MRRDDLDDFEFNMDDVDWLKDSPRQSGPEPSSLEEEIRALRAERSEPVGRHETPKPAETRIPPKENTARPTARTERPAADRADRPDRIRAAQYEPYTPAEEPRTRSRASRPAKDLDELEDVLAGSRRRRTSVPLIVLVVILVLGMVFAGWQLARIFLNYHRDRSAYNDLAANAISELAEAAQHGGTQSGEQTGDVSVRIVSEVPIEVDWAYLRSINSSIVGWLYCEGTVINYPVVQSTDHQFYLTHGFDKAPNTSGTLFADMDSVAGLTMSNFIIYGHNMKDKSMFGSFQNYVDRSYYEEHPTLYYLTPTASYRIELFGCHMTEGTTDNFPTVFSGASDYQAYIDRISGSCYWFEREKVNTGYQMITLSTCSAGEGYSDARLQLHGTMIPVQ